VCDWLVSIQRVGAPSPCDSGAASLGSSNSFGFRSAQIKMENPCSRGEGKRRMQARTPLA
jgi:hypothetical protein